MDISKLYTGQKMYGLRVDYVFDRPSNRPVRHEPFEVFVLGIDTVEKKVLTDGHGEFQLDCANPETSTLYRSAEPGEPAGSYFLFEDLEEANNYARRQTLLQDVWAKVNVHRNIRSLSNTQLEQMLEILNHPEGTP